MLHKKFQGNQPNGSGEEDFRSVFTIYGHGSHLSHVTKYIRINFHFLSLMSFHMKFGFK